MAEFANGGIIPPGRGYLPEPGCDYVIPRRLLPETMFRTTDFDDSTDEPLKPVTWRPVDEAADDEWYG